MVRNRSREVNQMRIGSPTVRTAHLSKEVQAFKRAADAFVRKATSSQKAADQTMMRLGIQDAKGNLTRRYK